MLKIILQKSKEGGETVTTVTTMFDGMGKLLVDCMDGK